MTDRYDASPQPSSLPSRIVGVFTAPGELFEELREEPVWLGALLVVVAAGLVSSLMMPEELLRETMMSQAQTSGGTEIPGDQIDQMVTVGMWASYIGAVVGPFVLAAALAGFMLFTFNLVLGGDASFRQLFSVSSHVLFIPAVGGLVTLPLILASGDLSTTLALHLLVPGLEADTYSYRFLHGLNVFSLAAAGVLGVGVSRLYPKRTAGNSATVMIGAYVAFKATMALFGDVTPGA